MYNSCVSMEDVPQSSKCPANSELLLNQSSFDSWIQRTQGNLSIFIIKSNTTLSIDARKLNERSVLRNIEGSSFGTPIKLIPDDTNKTFRTNYALFRNCEIFFNGELIQISQLCLSNSSFASKVNVESDIAMVNGYSFKNAVYKINSFIMIDFDAPGIMNDTVTFKDKCTFVISHIKYDIQVYLIGQTFQMWSKDRKAGIVAFIESDTIISITSEYPGHEISLVNQFISYKLAMLSLLFYCEKDTTFHFVPAVWKNSIIRNIHVYVHNKAKMLFDTNHIPIDIHVSSSGTLDIYTSTKITGTSGTLTDNGKVNIFGKTGAIILFKKILAPSSSTINANISLEVNEIHVSSNATHVINVQRTTVKWFLYIEGTLEMKDFHPTCYIMEFVFKDGVVSKLVCDKIIGESIGIYIRNVNIINIEKLKEGSYEFIHSKDFEGELDNAINNKRFTINDSTFLLNIEEKRDNKELRGFYTIELTHALIPDNTICIVPTRDNFSLCDGLSAFAIDEDVEIDRNHYYDSLFIVVPIDLGHEKPIPQFTTYRPFAKIFSFNVEKPQVLINTSYYSYLIIHHIDAKFVNNSIICNGFSATESLVDSDTYIKVDTIDGDETFLSNITNYESKELVYDIVLKHGIDVYNDSVVIDNRTVVLFRNRSMILKIGPINTVINISCHGNLLANLMYSNLTSAEFHYYGDYSYPYYVDFNFSPLMFFHTPFVPKNITIESNAVSFDYNSSFDCIEFKMPCVITQSSNTRVDAKTLKLRDNGALVDVNANIHAESLITMLNTINVNNDIEADNVFVEQSSNQVFSSLHSNNETPLVVNVSFTMANVPYLFVRNSSFSHLYVNVINDIGNEGQYMVVDFDREDPVFSNFELDLVCFEKLNCDNVTTRMFSDSWIFDNTTNNFELVCRNDCVSIAVKNPAIEEPASKEEKNNTTRIIITVSAGICALLIIIFVTLFVYRSLRRNRIESFVNNSSVGRPLNDSSDIMSCDITLT